MCSCVHVCVGVNSVFLCLFVCVCVCVNSVFVCLCVCVNSVFVCVCKVEVHSKEKSRILSFS